MATLNVDEHHPHTNWPIIHSQTELAEKALLQKQGLPVYAQQGRQLGSILIHHGVIDEKNLFIVRSIQKRPQYQDLPMGEVLNRIGVLKHPDDLPRALLIQSGVLMVDILTMDIPEHVSSLIPITHLREKCAVPVGVHYDCLYLAVADPFVFADKAFFNMLTGLKVVPVFTPMHDIVSYINTHDPQQLAGLTAKDEFFSLTQIEEDDPLEHGPEQSHHDVSDSDSVIVNLVNQMILHAIQIGASDIHIEMFHDGAEASIRLRRDGRMEHFANFPRIYYKAVISRIKVIARLDIANKRSPQDGKITFRTPDGKRIDLRVATIPSLLDIELVTIRVLTSGEPLPLSALGLNPHHSELFRQAFQQPYGLILVCGPTGSGKTTTLHSVLREINTEDRKIWTAEDPVEIVQSRLCQVQINPKAGLTFESVLRAFLRADPDVIMVGEIRDSVTAQMALEASMTGHLVFSTLHTNSSAETIARLLGLQIDAYNLADTLTAVLSQRLARRLCPDCSVAEPAAEQELHQLIKEYHQSAHGQVPDETHKEALLQRWQQQFGQNGKIMLRRPVGCKNCSDGYKGRVGLYELLIPSAPLRELVRQQAGSQAFKKEAVLSGMVTLKQDGIEKVLAGQTDMIQIYGACS